MNRLDEILWKIIDGGAYLLLWGVFLLLAGIVFIVSAVIGGIILGGAVKGIVVGLVVTFGGGYVLYKAGKRF